jgi:hypothetical protein
MVCWSRAELPLWWQSIAVSVPEAALLADTGWNGVDCRIFPGLPLWGFPKINLQIYVEDSVNRHAQLNIA